MKALLVALVVLSASGCAVPDPAEFRSRPSQDYLTNASADEIIGCIKSRGANDIEITPYPNSGRVELTVSTYKRFQTVTLHMATITPRDGGSQVSVRTSSGGGWVRSESEFRKLISECASPAA